MDDRDAEDPLRALGERLDTVRRKRSVRPRADGGGTVGGSALGQGLRIGAELVAAIGVGVGLGWLFDHGLGIGPAGVIVGFFVGVATGMWNVYRTVAGMGMAMGMRRRGLPGRKNDQDGSDEED